MDSYPELSPGLKRAIRFTRMTKINPHAVDRLERIGARVLLPGWILQAAGWWVQGLCIWAVLTSLGQGGTIADWPLYTVVASLSVVSGFLALVPAGFGGAGFCGH